MKVINVNDSIKLNNTIVTVGKFDGVHKGHEKLFRTMEENAAGRKKVVLAFESEPKDFLNHESKKTILTEAEKQLMCARAGIDVYMSMPLTEEFLNYTPEEFVVKILKEKIGATTIVCGADFKFGKQARGNIYFLKENQVKLDYNIIIVEKEQYNHTDISSTIIREKISQGKMDEVNEMLGDPYSIIGKVVGGAQIGRTIGLPTANIIPGKNKLLPPKGVYRSVVVYNHRAYSAITNIGVNPTVNGEGSTRVETHLLDFEGDLYDEIIEIKLYNYMRPERKFDNLTELKEQIKKDIEEITNEKNNEKNN